MINYTETHSVHIGSQNSSQVYNLPQGARGIETVLTLLKWVTEVNPAHIWKVQTYFLLFDLPSKAFVLLEYLVPV